MVITAEKSAAAWKTRLHKAQAWGVGQGLLIAGAFGYLYASILSALVAEWEQNPDYAHGFLVPVVSGYFAWERRHTLTQLPAQPSLIGLLVLVLGLALLVLGHAGASLSLRRVSMLVVLAGLVFYHGGWRRLQVMTLPIAFLLFMLPWPELIMNTVPLQRVAAHLSTVSLQLLDVPVYREGNIIFLPHATLEVVEACSGIRSVVSLLALAVVLASLTQRQAWKRLVLMASAIPIAILTNAWRIWGTGVLAHLYGAQVADGFYHTCAGWLAFAIAFILLIAEGCAMARFGQQRTPREAAEV